MNTAFKEIVSPLTEAELSNLRTACFTSSMRVDDPAWAAALDALAQKLDLLRSNLERKPYIDHAELSLIVLEELNGPEDGVYTSRPEGVTPSEILEVLDLDEDARAMMDRIGQRMLDYITRCLS